MHWGQRLRWVVLGLCWVRLRVIGLWCRCVLLDSAGMLWVALRLGVVHSAIAATTCVRTITGVIAMIYNMSN